MNSGIEFLEIYAEICLGMTAFFAIVATLRQTLGESLTPYQYLITRFFLEVGLLSTMMALAGLWVSATQQDDALAWKILAWIALITSMTFQIHYLRRRAKLQPPPPSSKTALAVTIVGVIMWFNLGSVLIGPNPMSIPTAAGALLMTNLASSVAVFLIFVGSFMEVDTEKVGVPEATER